MSLFLVGLLQSLGFNSVLNCQTFQNYDGDYDGGDNDYYAVDDDDDDEVSLNS